MNNDDACYAAYVDESSYKNLFHDDSYAGYGCYQFRAQLFAFA